MKTHRGLKMAVLAAIFLAASGGWTAAQSTPEGANRQAERSFASLQGLDFSRLRASASAARIPSPGAPPSSPAGGAVDQAIGGQEKTNYVVDARNSSVKFEIVTAAGTFDGVFKTFTADAQIDARDPSASKITVVIDMASSSVNSFLISDEFLHRELMTDRFPTSTMKVDAIKATGTKDVYEVRGDLNFQDELRHEILNVEIHWLKDGNMRLAGKLENTLRGYQGRVLFDVVLKKAAS